MSILSNLVGEVGKVVESLTVSSKEKKQIQADVSALIYRYEESLMKSQATVIEAEAKGNWLQKSWRPIVMLVFTFIVLLGTFTQLPILSDTSRFWDLLEIGIGGYVVGRSAEKVVEGLVARKGRAG